eukprot:m.283060 g.283060  ORF g.283060 m.283060 type:complete len:1596 (-) comp19410_c3_seq1:144-4931(-)
MAASRPVLVYGKRSRLVQASPSPSGKPSPGGRHGGVFGSSDDNHASQLFDDAVGHDGVSGGGGSGGGGGGGVSTACAALTPVCTSLADDNATCAARPDCTSALDGCRSLACTDLTEQASCTSSPLGCTFDAQVSPSCVPVGTELPCSSFAPGACPSDRCVEVSGNNASTCVPKTSTTTSTATTATSTTATTTTSTSRAPASFRLPLLFSNLGWSQQVVANLPSAINTAISNLLGSKVGQYTLNPSQRQGDTIVELVTPSASVFASVNNLLESNQLAIAFNGSDFTAQLYLPTPGLLVSDGVLLKADAVTRSGLAFDFPLGLLADSGNGGSSGSVRAVVAGTNTTGLASSPTAVDWVLQPAALVRGTVLSEAVSRSSHVLRAVVAVADAQGRPRTDTAQSAVVITASVAGVDVVLVDGCTPDPADGLCLTETLLPTSWFDAIADGTSQQQEPSVTVAAYLARLGQGTSVTLGSVRIDAAASAEQADASALVVATFPTRVVYPGEQFRVHLYKGPAAAGSAVRSFHFELAWPHSSLALIEASHNSSDGGSQPLPSPFAINTAVRGSTGVGLVGSYQGLDGSDSDGSGSSSDDLLCTLTLRLADGVGSQQQVTVDTVIRHLSTYDKVLVANGVLLTASKTTATPLPTVRAFALDLRGSGSSSPALVSVGTDATQLVVVRAERLQLLNLAALTGATASYGISIIGVRRSGTSSTLASTGQDTLACVSSNPDVVKVFPDCSALYLTGDETTAAGATITVTVENALGATLTAAIGVETLLPTAATVLTGRTQLSAVGGCSGGVFQSTSVMVTVTFLSAEAGSHVRVDGTRWLAPFVVVGDASVLGVSRAEAAAAASPILVVHGRAAGTSSVGLALPTASAVALVPASVTVVSETSLVVGVDLLVYRGLYTSVPLLAPDAGLLAAEGQAFVRYDQGLAKGDKARVHAELVFDDGSVQPVGMAGSNGTVTMTSLDPAALRVSEPVVDVADALVALAEAESDAATLVVSVQMDGCTSAFAAATTVTILPPRQRRGSNVINLPKKARARRCIEPPCTTCPSGARPMGDVNFDCSVSQADAGFLRQIVLDQVPRPAIITTLPEAQQATLDVDGNGVVDPDDAEALVRFWQGTGAILSGVEVLPVESDTNCHLRVAARVSSRLGSAAASWRLLMVFDSTDPAAAALGAAVAVTGAIGSVVQQQLPNGVVVEAEAANGGGASGQDGVLYRAALATDYTNPTTPIDVTFVLVPGNSGTLLPAQWLTGTPRGDQVLNRSGVLLDPLPSPGQQSPAQLIVLRPYNPLQRLFNRVQTQSCLPDPTTTATTTTSTTSTTPGTTVTMTTATTATATTATSATTTSATTATTTTGTTSTATTTSTTTTTSATTTSSTSDTTSTTTFACENGGTIRDNNKCNCRPGFEGRACEIDLDECLGRACPDGLVCVDGYGGDINNYTCVCDGCPWPVCGNGIVEFGEDCDSGPTPGAYCEDCKRLPCPASGCPDPRPGDSSSNNSSSETVVIIIVVIAALIALAALLVVFWRRSRRRAAHDLMGDHGPPLHPSAAPASNRRVHFDDFSEGSSQVDDPRLDGKQPRMWYELDDMQGDNDTVA